MAARPVAAGRVGRAHGLDGSFYVVRGEASFLVLGMRVQLAGTDAMTEIERRAGTDAKPIIRVQGCSTREAAEALRGTELLVERSDVPELEPGEFWADDLVGCAVADGATTVGEVARVIALPSCEVLEVNPGARLIPLVKDAVRDIDLDGRRIDVDLAFLGDA